MPESRLQLLVTLGDAYLDRAAEVIAHLKKAGLDDVEHLESIGVVKGTAPQSKIAALRTVLGVQAVEESEWIQLPPPDEPIQ